MATTTALLFPWTDSYSVHVGIIDMQHKNLVKIVNDLHQAMVEGHGRTQLGAILSELSRYTQVHFKTEENFMESQKYPDYALHKSEHDDLTKTVLISNANFKTTKLG